MGAELHACGYHSRGAAHPPACRMRAGKKFLAITSPSPGATVKELLHSMIPPPQNVFHRYRVLHANLCLGQLRALAGHARSYLTLPTHLKRFALSAARCIAVEE